ncbi:type II toxin-antitoxin system RelE/ParE family toxin [Variovorax sp.]|jgi:putative addiction module killer protein|uniref:type II toxin-antitoxin system RelE/ParE family toxin n=1 Tax=Variovorax sp. TaxID=1871043 RepID=UPI0012271FCB|nr:type II toxin-antitoxin system RelE/ParE family toxin [Variovorax sp.]TAJ61837.1 MAG: type II toxin-antitoxin system RelE/ParE family toxin [Variovorax sp.]
MVEVRRYQRVDGAVPLTDWLADLRDVRARAKLEIRFRRVSLGIFGDIKPVGEGVLELREDIGPGYRVYIGRHGAALVILLCGGDKRSQDADIQRAKEYWLDWKRRNT